MIAPDVGAQHFIGLNKEDTPKEVRKSGFYPDNLTVSQKFNYLKFVNSSDTKTLIVFFSEDNISTHTRTVCDYSEYDHMLRDFNESYKKVSKNNWEYEVNSEKYEVTLEEKEWYFVIRIKKKQNKKQVSLNG